MNTTKKRRLQTMMGFGLIGTLLFGGALLALLGGGAALFSRQTTGTRVFGRPERPTARQLLDERLARGEIDQEEYDRIRGRIG
jgi:uncharacterized membrane protein